MRNYANSDSSYTTVIGGGNMFFYDGEDYVEIGNRKDLNTLSTY